MRTPARSTGSASGIDTRVTIWNGVMPMPRAVSIAEAGTLAEPGLRVAGDRQQPVEDQRDQRRREADAADAEARGGREPRRTAPVSGPISRPKRAIEGTVWMMLRIAKIPDAAAGTHAGEQADRQADQQRNRQRRRAQGRHAARRAAEYSSRRLAHSRTIERSLNQPAAAIAATMPAIAAREEHPPGGADLRGASALRRWRANR